MQISHGPGTHNRVSAGEHELLSWRALGKHEEGGTAQLDKLPLLVEDALVEGGKLLKRLAADDQVAVCALQK